MYIFNFTYTRLYALKNAVPSAYKGGDCDGILGVPINGCERGFNAEIYFCSETRLGYKIAGFYVVGLTMRC